MAQAKKTKQTKNNGANVGYEAELWQMADALRGSMDAAEYKHVVLGLIFLKYISDAFEEQHAKLEAEKAQGADPEDPDEYRALNIFWVPPEARWSHLKAQAKQPTIGQLVDDAMSGIERDNASLKSVLPKDYARPALDKQRLGQLIDMISNIDFRQPSPEPSPTGRGSEMQYRGGYDFSGLAERARELRKKQTRAEELLWQLLRNRELRGAKFRRQHQFGDYLCDFYCDDAKLVVECDGDPHDEPSRIEHDAKRDAYLRSQGLKVLRFKNERVLNDSEKVLEEIATHLLPSPAGRRAGNEGGQEMHRKSFDLLGRVYEYFLSMFASAEGKKGGEFYTPRSVVKLLVEMIEPYNGRVYDPCCGSSGMFVQSVEFIRAHTSGNGNPSTSSGQVRKLKSDISIYGQESNYTTWRLAKMNLALRGIDGQIAHGDTFHNDRHPDLKADFILANPPFNISDWGGDRLREDKRWQFGKPPVGNANYAWVQHIIHHLAPTGIAGFVLANGSMSSNQSGEGEIRKNLIEADLVDCMIALPGQLFYSTQIPACLWFICRDKSGKPSPGAWRHPLPEGEGHYRGGFDFSGLVNRAREMRKNPTKVEAIVWEILRDQRFLNLKFRRQHQFGDYVVDFYCHEKRLVVELDGPVHFAHERVKIDQKRDGYLRSQGLTVVRLRNEDLLKNPESVLQRLAGIIKESSPAGRGQEVRVNRFRDRRGETLFIDARKLGQLVDRTHRELTDEEITRIANTYHAWRASSSISSPSTGGKISSPSPSTGEGKGEGESFEYADIAGFCKSATLDDIRKHGQVLTPGRYVGAKAQEDDGEPFEEKMTRLTAKLEEQFAESANLDQAIRENLKGLGYGG